LKVIHRHFDDTLYFSDLLISPFSVKIEVSILTEEGGLIDKRQNDHRTVIAAD